MKKLSLCIMAAFFMLSFNPTLLKAGGGINPVLIDSVKAIESEKADALIFRLKEIKGMDKSKLTSVEKKELRTEVTAIKGHLKEYGRGIYLSAGSIIIIVLLLIILL